MENEIQLNTKSEKLLRNTLFANAVFSTISSISILIFAHEISAIIFTKSFDFFGFGPSEILIEAAIGILLFAVFVLAVAKKKNVNQHIICIIMAMDVAWVIGSVVLLLLFSDFLSATGFWSILIIAGVVADFVIFQGIGMARINCALGALQTPLGKHA